MPTTNTQQGPMEKWYEEHEWRFDKSPVLGDLLTKAREFDTAFAALESALRDLLNGMGVCNVDRRWCVNHSMKAVGDATQCEEVADGYAALALAEGVRRDIWP